MRLLTKLDDRDVACRRYSRFLDQERGGRPGRLCGRRSRSLSSVDLTTATATSIGPTGQFLPGSAISPHGSLFATDFLGNLFSVSKHHRRGDAHRRYRRRRRRGPDVQRHNPDRHQLQRPRRPDDGICDRHDHCRTHADHQLFAGPGARDGRAEPEQIDVASDSPVSQSLVQVNLLTGTNTSLGQLPSMGAALSPRLISERDGVLYALDPFGNEFMIASNGAGIPVGIPAVRTGSISPWLRPSSTAPPVPGPTAWRCF